MRDITALRRDFAGQIVLPGDDGYGKHRTVWNAMVDRRPAVIARCAGRDDVAAAVRFGRAQGLEIRSFGVFESADDVRAEGDRGLRALQCHVVTPRSSNASRSARNA